MEKDKKNYPKHVHIITSIRNRMFGSKKRTIISIIILVIVILGIWKFANPSSSKTQYVTSQVQKGTIISTISESGNVSAGNQVEVGSPTDGVIADFYVKNGDQVQANQQLFKVTSTATPQQKAQAYAQYLSALSSLQTAQANMNSLQATLFKANQAFVTDRGVQNPSAAQQADPVYIEENATWLQAEANYKNQATVVSQAQASLTSAQLAYQATQDSIVTAPVDGTVANITVETGGNVSASTVNVNSSTTNANSNANTTSTSNSPVLSLGNFSNLIVKVQASEVDIPSIKTGQKATITLDAYPGKTFVGTVTNIDSIGTIASGVVTYNVYVSFLYAPPGVEPGMTASVAIETARHDNALEVPTSAVQTVNGSSYVQILQNGKLTQVPVTTGISSDTDTEITSGLSENEIIVTSVSQASTQSSTGASPFSGLTGGRGFGGGGGFGGGAGGGGGAVRSGGSGAGGGGGAVRSGGGG